MASASGCITLSLAFHAALLWGAATREPRAHHVAIDLTSNALALAFEPSVRAGEGHADGRAAAPSIREAAASRRDAEPSLVARTRPATGREPRSAPVSIRRPTPGAAPMPSPPPDAPPTPGAAPEAGDGAAAPTAAFVPPSGDGVRGLAAVTGSAPAGAGRAGESHGDGDGIAAPRGSTDSERRAALLEYAREVRTRIAAQREYPYAARRAQLHGTVCLRIALSSAGRLLAVEPTCGSSLGPLAKAALAAVTRASPFPPLPATLGQRLTLDVPVVFELAD